MYIEKNGPKGLFVTLTAEEVCGYFGSYEEMDGCRERTRSAISDILTRAGFFEKTHSANRLNVKVYPMSGGGCRIRFTESNGRHLTISRKFTGYELRSLNDMLAVCNDICRTVGGNICVSLYEKDGRYRLFIPLSLPQKTEKYCESEYFASLINNRTDKEKTREHWHTVCTDTPLKTICNLN